MRSKRLLQLPARSRLRFKFYDVLRWRWTEQYTLYRWSRKYSESVNDAGLCELPFLYAKRGVITAAGRHLDFFSRIYTDPQRY